VCDVSTEQGGPTFQLCRR